jgi:hypothetical protein
VLKLNEVEKIMELETMYIGSEKLLVHLDLSVRRADLENLEETIT